MGHSTACLTCRAQERFWSCYLVLVSAFSSFFKMNVLQYLYFEQLRERDTNGMVWKDWIRKKGYQVTIGFYAWLLCIGEFQYGCMVSTVTENCLNWHVILKWSTNIHAYSYIKQVWLVFISAFISKFCSVSVLTSAETVNFYAARVTKARFTYLPWRTLV